MGYNKCRECSRTTAGVLIKSPDDGDYHFFPDICSRCIMALSEEVDGKKLGEGCYTCKSCKAKVWILRDYTCVDCFTEAVEAVEKLPAYVEPHEPPLGYNIIGLSEEEAKAEFEEAYFLTPGPEDMEN